MHNNINLIKNKLKKDKLNIEIHVNLKVILTKSYFNSFLLSLFIKTEF